MLSFECRMLNTLLYSSFRIQHSKLYKEFYILCICIMKKLFGFLVVLVLIALGLLWLYLKNFATKAQVWSRENNYNITLPLWMQALPQTTGDLTDFIDKSRKDALEELGAIKEDKRAEFNAWLSGLQQKIEDKAREKAHQWVDEQFNGTWK